MIETSRIPCTAFPTPTVNQYLERPLQRMQGGMAPNASHDALAKVIVRAAQYGELPEDQALVAARLDSDALSVVRKALIDARSDVEAQIKTRSREIAPTVDDWINRAKKLEADIEKSKTLAKEIEEQTEEIRKIKADEHDLTQKANLLEREIDYTQRLRDVVKQIQRASQAYSQAQELAKDGRMGPALAALESMSQTLGSLDGLQSIHAVKLLADRADSLKLELKGQMSARWSSLFKFDQSSRSIDLFSAPASDSEEAESFVQLSEKLDLFATSVSSLARMLEDYLVRPRLDIKQLKGGLVPSLVVKDNLISLSDSPAKSSCSKTFRDMTQFTTTINQRLHPRIVSIIAEAIMPRAIEGLIQNWLVPALPTDVQSEEVLQDTLSVATTFSDHLAEIGWPGGAELNDWVDQIPRNWISKKRESSLASIRLLLLHQVNQRKTVERVETQTVEQGDVIPTAGNGSVEADDWDASWDDEETNVQTKQPSKAVDTDANEATEEEDASAWGWNDDEGAAESTEQQPSANEDARETNGEDDDGAAWDAWDTNDPASAPASPQRTKSNRTDVTNNQHTEPAHSTQNANGERTLTLRETYTTTGTPDALLELISRLGEDAVLLGKPPHSASPIAPAANGLHSIPTLLLAGYRALAPSHYGSIAGSNMFLYNDSLRLSAVLSAALEEQPEWLNPRMKLEAEVKTLDSFGRRAYGREMDSQRTILRDLLDGAQGFANCAEQPFKGACEDAVSMVVDRIKSVAQEWQSILSRSALLQSLGSLVSTVIGKVIVDVEDLTDIGSEESQIMRQLFDGIAKLDSLFEQDDGQGGKSSTTGVYTPNWFKFQYLAEIMDSSLADIKYLWTEGELKLEFDQDELIDLVQALFADNEHRRRAINEIRRG